MFEDKTSWEAAQNDLIRRPTEAASYPVQGATLDTASIVETAGVLCEKGNVEFRAGRDTAAVTFYTQAINGLTDSVGIGGSCPLVSSTAADAVSDATTLHELHIRLLSNRSAALMRQDQVVAALADVEKAASVHYSSVASPAINSLLAKCCYRRSLALLFLGRPAEALELAKASDNVAMLQIRKDCECMLAEQRDGMYDIAAMRGEATIITTGKLISLPRNRHADYESDNIRVETIPAKGRAVFANALIPSGTLIMASRAFVLVRNESEILHSSRGMAADLNSQAAILPYVVRQVWKQPETAPRLYSLSGGNGFPGDSGEVTQVDVPRIIRILTSK